MGGAVPTWWRPGVRLRQPTTIEELLDRVVVCPSGCWIWAGGVSGERGDRATGIGYGRILRPGTRNAMAAHRYVYETFVGQVPVGWHVDHLCRQWTHDPLACRRCVRPEHLEAVPYTVNMARRDRDNGRAVDLAMLVASDPDDDWGDPLADERSAVIRVAGFR